MATASKAGAFRIDKYKSNGISMEVIRTRMEDLAIQCQRELRLKHVAKRRNIDVQLEELEQPNASEDKKLTEKGTIEGSNSHETECKPAEDKEEEQSAEEERQGNDQEDEIGRLAKQVIDGENRYQAIQTLRRRVSVEHQPPLDDVIDSGVIPSLVQCLDPKEPENLQVEAAWVLTNIASGNNRQTAAVVKGGAVPRLVQLLQSHDQHIRDQVLWALGNIAGDCAAYRDMVIEYGIVGPLFEILDSENEKPSLRRNASWTLSNLCRHRDSPLDNRTANQFVPVLNCVLCSCQDVEVLKDCLWSVSYLFEFSEDKQIMTILDTGMFDHIVKILGHHEDDGILLAGMRATGNITSGSDQATQVIVDSGGLAPLLSLLDQPRINIRKEVFWALSNITAGTIEQKQAVLEAGFLHPILDAVVESDLCVKKEALWTLTNLTEGAPDSVVQTVLESDGLKVLGSALCCSHNIGEALMLNLLGCLEQLLARCPTGSHYREAVDEECMDVLKELCKGEAGLLSSLGVKARHILDNYLTTEE